MTATQSRFGGAAEVGRMPTKETQKTKTRYGGMAASAGLIGAGGAVANRGKKYDSSANASLFQVEAKNERRRANVTALKDLHQEKAVHEANNRRFAEHVYGARDKGVYFRAPSYQQVSIKPGANRSELDAAGKELTGRISQNKSKQMSIKSANRQLLDESRHHRGLASAAKKTAGRLRVGGATLGVAGLAGLAASMHANETKRGNISQSRSTNGPKPVSLAEARYRRVNGI